MRANEKSHVIMSVRDYEHVGCVWSCWETHSNAHTYFEQCCGATVREDDQYVWCVVLCPGDRTSIGAHS